MSRTRPTAVAVECGDERLTYAQLEAWSDETARTLRATTPPGPPVAVAVPRSVPLLVALLGVLKAGRPYLPLDADDPPDRLRRVLDVSGSTLALVTDTTRDRLAAQGLRTLVLPARFEDPAAGETERSPSPTDRDSSPTEQDLLPTDRDSLPTEQDLLPANRAPLPTEQDLLPANRAPSPTEWDPLPPVPDAQPVYVLFTSGSTGTPKGVVLPSAALTNRLVWMRDAYGAGPDDRVLQKTPITFDVSGWELWLPLISGGTCVLLPPGEHREPGLVARAIRERGITLCHFVPTMLREFLRHRDAARCTSLRHVFCSGEALPAEVARACVDTIPAALHNLYGPTEAAIEVSHWTVPAPAREIDRVLIGRPIDNCVLLVVGQDDGPVLDGDEGELCIGGTPLALGYLDDPVRTARAFVPAPPGSSVDRIYRTGDRVRLIDGNLEYLGRTDDQVKIRGQRIEPQEVEHRLHSHPSVNEAVVVAVRLGEDTELVAWIRTAEAGTSPRELSAALRAHIASALPSAYVPGHYLTLDGTPRTGSGKLDRAGLRARAEQRLGAGRNAPVAPTAAPGDRPLLAALLRERDTRAVAGESRDRTR
ncbi:amino acid adenylation domain-containing protein [Streptomyces sp. NPDC002466]|uniref:amino acid adenylation domain-containing protein n=1 Tax=Streptomyces sp. NPDC002466 TaxID=3364646 RepID=UPI0036935BE6